MKSTFLFFLLSIGAVFAETKAQTIVSLSIDDGTLLDVIQGLEKKTDYTFVYNVNEIDLNEKINVNVRNEELVDVLEDVFVTKNISYKMMDRHIALFYDLNSQQKENVISGVVLDVAGSPVIGATVLEKGTTNGVSSDVNGKFSLKVSKGSVLQISYIGYTTQEIKIEGEKDITVILEEDSQLLDEIIVVGYGVQKKVNLTGAISSVSADVLENRTSSNPENMLTGNVAGVTIIQNSGQPGDDSGALRVRGVGTLGNSDAMVLIDGIESSLSNINPNDISNISILKDAAAASIYGVRAANGVVLITTKRGEIGKPKLSYNGYSGWQNETRVPDFLDSYNYAILANEALANDGLAPIYLESDLQKYKDGSDPDNYPNSNQIKTLLSENGFFHNHHLSLTGGSDNVQYALSIGYHSKDGLMQNMNYNKFNIRSNIDAKINSKLSIMLDLAAHRSDMSAPAYDVRGIMYNAFRESPTSTIQFQNGNYGLFLNETNSVAFTRNGGIQHAYDNNFQGNTSFTYEVLDGLSLKGIASTRFNLKDEHSFKENLSFYTVDSKDPTRNMRSMAWNKDTKMIETNLQAYLNYNKTFGKHSVAGLLGYSQLYNQYRILEASRQDLPLNNSLGEINAGNVVSQETAGNLVEYALRSVFARVNYSYDNRYLLEANIRYDGTSRFPKDNRFGAFPSFSAAWRISEESFMDDVEWLDNIKLRGSWGLLGNQEIGNYAFYNTYMFGENYTFGNALIPGVSINSTMENLKITWEKTDQIDIGLDFDALNGKIGFTGDFFIKNTNDILLSLPIPEIVGVGAPLQNAGKVRNTGFELQLRHTNQVRDFKYYGTFNLSYVHNEIIDLSGGDTPGRSVGDPINNIYGYVSEGIFNSQEEIDSHPTQTWGAQPGDLKYKDLNNDGKVDEQDRESIGTYFPKINFGLKLGFEYKNIDFSALLQGAGMVDGIVAPTIGKAFYNGGKVTTEHLDRWTPENKSATYPRLSMSSSSKNWHTSTFWMQDASYLKLRNIQLGYTLPSRTLASSGIDRVRIYCSIDNLFTITQFEGIDPEGVYNMRTGDGSSYYPITVNYSFGINLSF